MGKHSSIYSRVGVILCCVFLTCFDPFGSGQTKASPECAVAILSPTDGHPVSGTGDVRGNAKIPPGSHLWVLAHKRGVRGWWPQGGGEAQIEDDETGTWLVYVTYGVESDKGPFEVAAIAVDENAHRDLQKWVKNAPERSYPPTDFPASVRGCPIARVTVDRQ